MVGKTARPRVILEEHGIPNVNIQPQSLDFDDWIKK